jgi:peroxiredoxin
MQAPVLSLPRRAALAALGTALVGATLALVARPAAAQSTAAVVGAPAPAFSVTDVDGKAVSLADFKGRHVVLEWTNPSCPFVVKHYGSGNMQGTQKDATDKGVVWLTINSTATDHPEHLKPAAMGSWMKQQKAASTTTLLDPDGRIGRAYGARTTPHLYVIDPQGRLVYAGGIDDKPTANPADIATAKNHVKAALAESLAGKPVTVAQTRAYGCSIKYGRGA